MRITDIADILGYSSIGAFTRWHSQTFGMSPRQKRSLELKTGGVQSHARPDQMVEG
jgi:AraC-like DNA-binding protein